MLPLSKAGGRGCSRSSLSHPVIGAGRRSFARDKAEVGADGAAGEPVPVPDLHGQAERCERGNPAQAFKFPDDRCVLAVVGDFGDGLIDSIPPFEGFDGEIIGQLQGLGIKALTVKPAYMSRVHAAPPL